MGIPILDGHEFEAMDDAEAERVIVISQAMADRFFFNREPVGSIVRVWDEDRRVVGVAKTGKNHSLRESPQPFMYLPQAQECMGWKNLHICTVQDPKAILAPALALVHEMDPTLPLFTIDTMEHNMGFVLMKGCIVRALVGLFGGIALILSITGIYGVMAYSVAHRTNELGIRMAIGAQKSDVFELVLKKGMVISIVGMVIGLAFAPAASFGLSTMNRLHDVSALDPVVFGLVLTLLLAVAPGGVLCIRPTRDERRFHDRPSI